MHASYTRSEYLIRPGGLGARGGREGKSELICTTKAAQVVSRALIFFFFFFRESLNSSKIVWKVMVLPGANTEEQILLFASRGNHRSQLHKLELEVIWR